MHRTQQQQQPLQQSNIMMDYDDDDESLSAESLKSCSSQSCDSAREESLDIRVQIEGMELLALHNSVGDISDSLVRDVDDCTWLDSSVESLSEGASLSLPRSPMSYDLPDFPSEVDSLFLNRRRFGNFNKSATRADRMMKIHEEGSGLFGENDSVHLTEKRLPRHARKNWKQDVAQTRLIPIEAGKTESFADDSITVSTTTTETSSSDLSTLTVDSLILTRMRFLKATAAKKQTERHNRLQRPTRDRGENKNGRPSKVSVVFTKPPRRWSSSACAA